jgi:hypothetical protein
LFGYVGGNPVNWFDPEGLTAKKGPNHGKDWRGQNKGWNPANSGPKPSSPFPKGYKPGGVNNLPGQNIEWPTQPGKGARATTGIIRCLGKIGEFLEILTGYSAGAYLILYIPIDNDCIEPGCTFTPFDPNTQT